MPRHSSRTILAAFALAMSASAGVAATASLKDADGKNVGTVTLAETPNGVFLDAELTDLPPGEHGFHVHATGKCDPDFGAAGGHLQGDSEVHGFIVADGPHAGDMPNIHVPESGSLRFEVFAPALSFETGSGALFDGDGAAIVIHAGADDYASQPAGDAGNRIACGVIER